MTEKRTIEKLPHHVQQRLCQTRPPYRQGKKLTSVKVYTINNESQHLMICGVPKLQLGDEVKKLVCPYGDVKKIHVVSEYPTEEFTEAYHVQYARIQSARIAKRFIDGKNFYGGSLHVFYVPELESVSETRTKLLQRRRDVAVRIKRNQRDAKNPDVDKFIPKEQYHRKKKNPALPLTEERLIQNYPGETLFSIYDGIPQDIDPRTVSEPSLPSTSYYCEENNRTASEFLQAPYHSTEAIIKTAQSKESQVDSSKTQRKNYKGQSISDNVKVKVIRPQIIDTSTIVKWDTPQRKKDTARVRQPKKVDSNITIKLIPKNNDTKKRILIKNPSVTQLLQPSEDLQLSIDSAKSQIREAMRVRTMEKSAPLS